MTVDVRVHSLDRFAREVELSVITGPDVGLELHWERPELRIGSADDCDLVLTDVTVSRYHCVIKLGPGGVFIHDLGSTNGITIGGYNVGTAQLKPGAIIGLGCTRLQVDAASALQVSDSDGQRFGPLIGRSRVMKRLFTRIAQIASSSSTVLIEGETGTGKDIIAETIHMKSARAHCPFVTFDCARVTPTLMESELFGHVRGAFTGADAHRSGILETAHGGTVFFDEMGELPLELQPKLLRALEKRELSRLGSVHARRIDVRIIAATNRDIRQMVAQGQFRSDLYYRLNVMKVHVPPLRDHVEDIDLLATHFLRQITGNPEAALPSEVLGRMERYDWPGNVRELRTAVERWHVLSTSRRLHDIAIFGNERLAESAEIDAPEADISFRDMKSKAVDEWERCFVDKLIRRHDGNISKAARAAQMNRNYLTLLLRRHGVAVCS